jgi:hypothetical protein
MALSLDVDLSVRDDVLAISDQADHAASSDQSPMVANRFKRNLAASRRAEGTARWRTRTSSVGFTRVSHALAQIETQQGSNDHETMAARRLGG